MEELEFARDRFDLDALLAALLQFAGVADGGLGRPEERIAKLDETGTRLADVEGDLGSALQQGETLVFPFTEMAITLRENGSFRCADGDFLEVEFDDDLMMSVPELQDYGDDANVSCALRVDQDRIFARLGKTYDAMWSGEVWAEEDEFGPLGPRFVAFLERFSGS